MKFRDLVKYIFFIGFVGSSAFAKYPRVGYEAYLKTIFHNVSGKVTIVDTNTLAVENFTYDGVGPSVYFYLGTEISDVAFANGLRILPLLTGTAYNNSKLVLNLTGPSTLDNYNAISVWCEDFHVDFGSGVFLDYDPFISWTFGNIDTQSYALDAFEPNDIAFGEIGTEDPNLTLFLEHRFEVTVSDYVLHPLEIIAKDSAPAGDMVLLSMKPAVTGTFESDPNVSWQDDGTGSASFTVTQNLYDAMIDNGRQPGYRCGIHVSLMRGNFFICTEPLEEDTNSDCKIDFSDFALWVSVWLADNRMP
jgi:hypothetical protein